jgi:nicotinamide mononucleotide adenylyltransferase
MSNRNYLAKASSPSSSSSSNDLKYAMYIGRWQPFHDGHHWLINQKLIEGKKVLICIRDVEPDEKNIWTAKEIEENLKTELKHLIEVGSVKLLIIPDIESVNIGRDVGYDVIEHCPPTEIKSISATAIREKMKKNGKL